MPTFDFHLPDFSTDPATLAKDIKKLKDCVYMLNEQLRYQFSHIDEENIAAGAITEDSLETDLKRKVQDTAGNYSILKQTANAIEAKVSSIDGDVASLQLTAEGLLSKADAASTYSTISQTAAEISFAVSSALSGFNNLIAGTSYGYANLVYAAQTYRDIKAKAAITGYDVAALDTIAVRTYIDNPSGESVRLLVKEYSVADVLLASNYGDYVTTATYGYSGVTFTLDADTTQISIGIESAGAITETLRYKQLKMEMGAAFSGWTPHPTDPAAGVKTSYITVDNDSIDIASGGALNLSAASQITIGTAPFGVGGMNYYSNTAAYTVLSSGVTVNGRNAEDYLNGFAFVGPNPSGGILRLDNIITGNGYWTIGFDVRGTQSLAIPITVDICDLGATQFYTNSTNTYERKTLTVNVTNYSSDVYNFVDFSGFAWAYYRIRNIKIEKGSIATDWSENPGELHNSSITIDSDGIEILSGGDLIATAPGVLQITGGSTDATAIAIRNDTDYFISAGDLTQADAPFYVKKDGSIKSTSGTIGGFTIGSTSLYNSTDIILDSDLPGIQIGQVILYTTDSGFILWNPAAAIDNYTSAIICDNGPLYISVVDSWIQMGTSTNPTLVYMGDDVYIEDVCSALGYVDRTPAFTGNALEALSAVKDDGSGLIDHATLPEFARKTIKKPPPRDSIPKDGKGNLDYSKAPPATDEEGRDIGAMVSILTKAVQELMAVNEEQNSRIGKLEETVVFLQKQIDTLTGTKINL